MSKLGGGGYTTVGAARDMMTAAVRRGELTLVPMSQVLPKHNGSIRIQRTTKEVPDFTEAVNNGARLLDEADPGWWRVIDTSTLDLDDQNHCVLGQSWGHYVRVKGLHDEVVHTRKNPTEYDDSNFKRFLRRIGLNGAKSEYARNNRADHGFDLSSAVINWAIVEADRRTQADGRMKDESGTRHRSWEVADELWELLTTTWLVLIRARQDSESEARRRLVLELEGLSPEEAADRVLEMLDGKALA